MIEIGDPLSLVNYCSSWRCGSRGCFSQQRFFFGCSHFRRSWEARVARGAVAPLAALFAADTFQGSSSISAEAGGPGLMVVQCCTVRWAMKKPWLFRLYRGWKTTQFNMGILISQYQDPYKPTSIMESRRVFFVAQMCLNLNFGKQKSAFLINLCQSGARGFDIKMRIEGDCIS